MIEVAIKDFSRAAKIACAAVQSRSSIPILSTIKVRANGKLELEATDLDMTVHASLPATTDGKVEFLLDDPRSVLSAIGAAGGATAKFEALTGKDKKGGYSVTAGALTRRAEHGMPVDDFPSGHTSIAQQTFSATLTVEILHQIERIASAISTEETRYYLNGINLKRVAVGGGGWTHRFTATDGHRLMMVDVPLPDATGVPGDVILPRELMVAIFAHLRGATGPLTLEIGNGVIRNEHEGTAPPSQAVPRVALAGRVGAADIKFSGRTIDGKYPDTDRVIPKAQPHQALLPVGDFRRGILAVTGGKSAKWNMPAIRLSFDEKGLIIGFAFGVTGVTAQYHIDCQHNAPKGFAIGFRAGYVLEILNAMRGTDITFGFTGAADPATFRDVTDPSFLSVLMPMKLG